MAYSGNENLKARYMALAAARAKYATHMYAMAAGEQARLQQEQDAANEQGLGSMWGSAAQGAMAGTMIGGPGLGTAIGAGAGLLFGGAAEVQNRKAYHQGRGEDYGTFAAIGDTIGRAPNLQEVGTGLGAAPGIAGSMRQQTMDQDRKKFLEEWRRGPSQPLGPATEGGLEQPSMGPLGPQPNRVHQGMYEMQYGKSAPAYALQNNMYEMGDYPTPRYGDPHYGMG